MAKDTRNKIIQSAQTLFAESWFETVSVAEICRHAGLSNGVFYRYFKKKEDLIRIILDDFLLKFSGDLEGIGGDSPSERLLAFIRTVMNACRVYSEQVTIFREGQYRFPEYEAALRDLYMSTVRNVMGREVPEEEYLYIVSGVRFCSTRQLYDSRSFSDETLHSLILHGVFPGMDCPFVGWTDSCEFREPDEEDTTRLRLIRAGIRLFGEQGYFPVNIHQIVSEAGYAVGTFYKNFQSKEEFLIEIVRCISHKTRYFLAKEKGAPVNRLEQELLGIRHFLEYFSLNREFYEIVREAEFVNRESVRNYYNDFEKGYLKSLAVRDGIDRETMANFLIGFSHYMGIEFLFSRNLPRADESLNRVKTLFSRGIADR